MEDVIEISWYHLTASLKLTGIQILLLLGPLAVYGWLMHRTAGALEAAAGRLGGRAARMFFRPGVLVHELSHLVMCVVFFHRVTRIRLFDFDPDSSRAGYVAHRYNPRSLYQRIGGFFIGTAPLFAGALILYGAARWLMPGLMVPDIAAGLPFPDLSQMILARAVRIAAACLAARNLADWRFWLFLYLCVCIGSGMKLSGSDMAGAVFGFVVLALFAVFVNLAMLVFYPVGGTVSMLRLAAAAYRWIDLYLLLLLVWMAEVLLAVFLHAVIAVKERSGR